MRSLGYVALCLALFLSKVIRMSGETKHALIIGINTYEPRGTQAQHPSDCVYGRCGLGYYPNLTGAVNDAVSMADLLTSPKFGFLPANVALLTNPSPQQVPAGINVLPASQTTHDGLLAVLTKYLLDVPQSGDTVVVYFAGHGSLRVNSLGEKLTVLVDKELVHADSTLVPSDIYLGNVHDVRDREITDLINKALDRNIHVTVILDSCHSGGVTRGLQMKGKSRELDFDPVDIKEAPPKLSDGKPMTPPSQRKVNPALIFSAAQQDQSANETPPPDIGAEPHGAFTAALIEALQVLPADAPSSAVYARIKAVLEGDGVQDQDPDLDASAERRRAPLFGGQGSPSGKTLAAVLKVDTDGQVWLDVGRVCGVGVGSEFIRQTGVGTGTPIKLQIGALVGISRSKATVVGPTPLKLKAGDTFELSKLVPADQEPLKVWMSPGLPTDVVLKLASEARDSRVSLISDPEEEKWTDVLSWDGTSWKLLHVGASASVDLGTTFTGVELKRRLSADSRLWINVPPPLELVANLQLSDQESAVQLTAEIANANYVLAGSLSDRGPVFAWVYKEAALSPRPDLALGHSPGCSTTSAYPVRTDWISILNASQADNAENTLNSMALRLGKLHGWLQLANSPAGASAEAYYSLGLVGPEDTVPLSIEKTVIEGDRMRLALISTTNITKPRFIYVLDIDCHGAGTLLYPADATGNRFPNDSDTEKIIPLPGMPVVVAGPPFGVETVLLLSTAEPLPDPYVLNFEGVTRDLKGTQTPLERLLSNASAGTRTLSKESPAISTTWGLQVFTLKSVPARRIDLERAVSGSTKKTNE